MVDFKWVLSLFLSGTKASPVISITASHCHSRPVAYGRPIVRDLYLFINNYRVRAVAGRVLFGWSEMYVKSDRYFALHKNWCTSSVDLVFFQNVIGRPIISHILFLHNFIWRICIGWTGFHQNLISFWTFLITEKKDYFLFSFILNSMKLMCVWKLRSLKFQLLRIFCV